MYQALARLAAMLFARKNQVCSVSYRRDHLADGVAKAGGGIKLPASHLPAPSLAGRSVYSALAGPAACSFPPIALALCICDLQSTTMTVQLIW